MAAARLVLDLCELDRFGAVVVRKRLRVGLHVGPASEVELGRQLAGVELQRHLVVRVQQLVQAGEGVADGFVEDCWRGLLFEEGRVGPGEVVARTPREYAGLG